MTSYRTWLDERKVPKGPWVLTAVDLASVGRNPEGEDREDGLRAEHEHAVTPKAADAQPLDISEQPQ